jgi:hypothetical protein
MAGKIDILLSKLNEAIETDDSVRVAIERRQRNPDLTGKTKPELVWQGEPLQLKKEIDGILSRKFPRFSAAEVDLVQCGAFRLCQTCLFFKPEKDEPDGLCLYRQSESDDHIAVDPIMKFRVREDASCDGWRPRKASWKSPQELPDIPNFGNVAFGFANNIPCKNNQNVLDGRPWENKAKNIAVVGYLNNALSRMCATCRFFGFPNVCRIVDSPVTINSFCHLYTDTIEVIVRPVIDPHQFGNTERIGPDGEFAWKEEKSEKKLTGSGD